MTEKADELPLGMIEGINMFHRVRLSEVGVDNAQNLASASLVELMLRTPFRSSQLIDWIAQAKLYVHFKSNIGRLRDLGIRTIFDFKSVCGIDNKIPRIAQETTMSQVLLESVYQQIKDDPRIAALSEARDKLSIV